MLRPAFPNRQQPKYLDRQAGRTGLLDPPGWEIAGIAATNSFVRFNAGPDKRKVHLHRDLTGTVGVDVFAHVPVG